jgi:hypothetical protein
MVGCRSERVSRKEKSVLFNDTFNGLGHTAYVVEKWNVTAVLSYRQRQEKTAVLWEKPIQELLFNHKSHLERPGVDTDPPSCKVKFTGLEEKETGGRKPMASAMRINSLNTELNTICHSLILLEDLTFMGPCIVSIFQYISNKMQH